MKMILGKKIGMTQCFYENGQIVPATIIYVEPNLVIENKTKDKHGYDATKVGVFTTEEKKMIKPEKGVFDKLKLEPKKLIREFRDVTGYKVGDKITADIFAVGENVDAQALTKGKGFTGAIKRWNFATGPKSHGAGFPHRFQGSISFGRGGSQGQRVMKGKKMSGHMGCELVTISNLLVIKLELDKNLILVKGSIPGPNNSIVILKSSKKKNRNTSEIKVYDLLTKNNSNASSQKVEDIKNESSNLSQENIEHANVATSQEQKPIETNLVEENTINNQQEKLKENVETVSAEVSNSESNQNVETVSAEVSNSESNQNVESKENSSSSTSGETEKENKENSGE